MDISCILSQRGTTASCAPPARAEIHQGPIGRSIWWLYASETREYRGAFTRKEELDRMYYSYIPSPIGKLILVGDQSSLQRIGFEEGKGAFQPGSDWELSQKPFGETIRQLDAYFEGRLRSFCLPLAAVGTAFQRLVWDRLLEIPYGTTISYAELASLIERPKAVRAVGSANGANPLPIVVPCHRVIGSDGRLVGYGGGLHIKEYLLRLERSSE